MTNEIQAFDQLIARVNSSNLPLIVQKEAVAGLKYFSQQLTNSNDRRDHAPLLRDRWRSLEQKFQGHAIGLEVSRNPAIRRALNDLGVHVAEVAVDPMDKWDADQFFRHVRVRLRTPQPLSEIELSFAEVALLYLEREAKSARTSRDMTAIQKTWKEIHPLLEKAGLLKQFASNSSIKSRIQFFLTGKV